jgi:hypothetical protein
MTTATKLKLLDGLLIDPFRKEVRRCRVADDLATWYRLLECDTVDRWPIASDAGSYLDIWFDDEFLFKEPIWPAFRLTAAASLGSTEHVLHGYGLVLACDRNGKTKGLTSSAFSVQWLIAATGLCFESWEQRLPQEDYLDQLLRTPELELAGRFEYADTDLL